jgi:hypothetical protein
MSDLPLLDWQPQTKSRKRGPETSKAAARKAQAWCTPQCNTLLLYLQVFSAGLTRAELIRLSGIKESSCCARLKAMEDGSIIEVRGVRPGPYGPDVQVYYITERGLARAKVLRDMACQPGKPSP